MLKRLLIVAIVILASLPSVSHAQDTLVVAPDGQYTSIEAALAAAQDGDTIEVHGGVYDAPLHIKASVKLVGIGSPVIDGQGEGSLVYISAPNVTLRGFTLRNTGHSILHEDAAVVIEAQHVTVEDNHLEDIYFGISFANADYSIARRNIIHGQDLDVGSRGDGIRVWYSNFVQIVDNEVLNTRDILINYANDAVISGNRFNQNRYGLHFMYSQRVDVLDNEFNENMVGAFLMYAQDITIARNTFGYNRGSSAYGLALKDADNITVQDNLFIGNLEGLYLDNSPSLYEGINTFTGNVFAYNDIGVTSLPSVERNIFEGNSFLNNLQQVGIHGREITSRNTWTGNYWSDYTGYDRDGNGLGEQPYHADKLFEQISDAHPNLQLFAYSPAAQMIEFTAAAFPIFRPEPRLVDDSPMLSYQLPAHVSTNQHSLSLPFLGVSLGMIVLAILLAFRLTPPLAPPRTQGGESLDKKVPPCLWGRDLGWGKLNPAKLHEKANVMIVVENLIKKYQGRTVLDGLSFSIQAGESVALWGMNGAGKTTTLKCMLGLLPFEGNLSVNGIKVQNDGKAVRTAVGYVPQEVAFYDLTVRETLSFYARLKKVAALDDVLTRVGLMEQANKPVKALSGGMKQRLALAISLLSDPPILLLDEPTANLDAQAQSEFLQLVQSLNHAGKTIIFSSHRVDEVAALAQRVLILEAGKVAFDCTPAELARRVGVQSVLRIQVSESQRQDALILLDQMGFAPHMNSTAFYVSVDGRGKMIPLRILEDAQIPVHDFEVIETRLS